MKKTMLVLFQNIGMKALAGFVLAIALTFAASTSLSAQNPKPTTPVEKMQFQLDYINQNILDVLDESHPKYDYYVQMANYLQTVLNQVAQGVGLHEAIVNNQSLKPVSPAQTGQQAKVHAPTPPKGNG